MLKVGTFYSHINRSKNLEIIKNNCFSFNDLIFGNVLSRNYKQ